MRRGRSAADGSEILRWCGVAKGPVGPVVVEAVGEGVDERLQLVDAVRQGEAGVELLAPSALVSFDGAVELQTLWRQDNELEALVGAGLFEGRLELRSAIDLDAGD